MRWALIDAEGCIDRSGRNSALPSGAVSVPEPFDEKDPATIWFDGTDWQDRPASPTPVLAAGSVTITGCPKGAAASVVDTEAETVLATVPETAGTIAISLPDPGTYRIEVTFPKPYRPTAAIVVVP